MDRLSLRPSTALADMELKRVSSCHAVLLSAMFSAKYMRKFHHFRGYDKAGYGILDPSKGHMHCEVIVLS